jgi:magnesium transporter
VVQSLANPGFLTESLLPRLGKVFLVAMLNGILLALIVFGANILLFTEWHLSLTVSVSLFSVVLFASFMGTITPMVLNYFGFNPALASGPFITTINDLLGLTIYFLTVKFLLL